MHAPDADRSKEQLKAVEQVGDISIFEDICENANDLIQCVDKQGKFVYVNRKWMKTLGYSRGEIDGLRFNDVLRRDQRRKCVELFKKVCNGETLENIEAVFVSKDGHETIVQGTVSPRFKDGKVTTTIGIFRDVALRKKQEEALIRSEEHYRLISENTSDFISILDTGGNYVYVSPSHRQLGYEPAELIGTSGLELIHPDDKKALLPLMLKYARTKIKDLFKLKMKRATEYIKFRIPDKSGKWHFIESTANLIDNPDKKGYGFLLISHDMTERRQMEDALKESEERYRDLVEKAGNAIAVNDLAGNFKYFNEKFPELFGYTHEEMTGKTLASLVHPDDAERILAYHKERLTGVPVPFTYEFKGMKKGGSTIHLEANVVLLKDGETIIGTRAYLWDITGRKKTEEELRTLSLIDQLAGLYNRRGFTTLVQQQVDLANRTMKGFFIIYLDIDGLKSINDNLGHYQGDVMLKATAQVCIKSFRKSDIIGRLGGDEFAICAIGALKDSEGILANRLQKNLADYNRHQQKDRQLSLSIGFAYYNPQNPVAFDELLKQADLLMYEHKKQKRGMVSALTT